MIVVCGVFDSAAEGIVSRLLAHFQSDKIHE